MPGPSDIRVNPFNNATNYVNLTERHIVPSVSPFVVRLNEVPEKQDPSNMQMYYVDDTTGQTTETALTEVAATPGAGEFRPDYSTNAFDDTSWNTGLIEFSSSDAGKIIEVSYTATGTLAGVKTNRYPGWWLDRGDGSDGDFVPTGNTAISGVMNYKSVYIKSGITVTVKGYALIKCQGVFLNAGTIKAVGTGAAGTGGTGSVSSGGSGTKGDTGTPLVVSNGGKGGNGSKGWNGTSGGTGGYGSTKSSTINKELVINGYVGGNGGGGGGGAGGGSSTPGKGSAGGIGGGSVIIIASEITVGTIDASGSNGTAGGKATGTSSGSTAAGGGGGGGAGGGGAVICIGNNVINGSIDISGGTGGAGGSGPGGTGGKGGNGSDGLSFIKILGV